MRNSLYGASPFRSRLLDQSGTSILELAIATIFLIPILMGIIQWSMLAGAKIALDNAASITVRHMTLDSVPQTTAEAESVAKPAVYPILDPAILTASIDAAYPLSPGMSAKEVIVNYPLHLFFPIVVPQSSGSTFQLKSTAYMR